MKIFYDIHILYLRTLFLNSYSYRDFKSCELGESATIRIFRIVQKEGTRQVKREVEYGNIKGFVLDDECLKQGSHFVKDYFDELLLDKVAAPIV